MKKSTVVDIISSLYVLLFLYTGLVKIIDLKRFHDGIQKSPIIRKWAWVAAPTIPLTELIITALLLTPMFIERPKWRKWGLLSGSILMALFTGYIYYMLHFEKDVPCTCGGIIQQMTWRQHLYFNACFSLLGFFGYWLNNRQLRAEDKNLTTYHPGYQKV